jgi:hypothetical protein
MNILNNRSQHTYITISQGSNSNLSPLTGRVLASGRGQPLQVTYSPNDSREFLSGINNADLVFEYLSKSGSLVYNAIFYDNTPFKTKPITNIQNISMYSLPKLTFSSSINKLYSNKKNATYIFVTLSYNIFSNFIYEDGYYVHYKDCVTDIDCSNQQPVSISNIVIQYVRNYDDIDNISSKANGKGVVFCGGKVIDIEWSKDGSSPIKIEDEKGNPVTLMEGKTWWLIINDKCPVAFN